jgi:sodium-dependent dicarboxylate transporter 2/3/5
MFIDGWGDFLKRITDRGNKSTVGDATPALLMVMVIFALPTHYRFWPFQSSKLPSTKSPSLVSWELIEKKLPWGVILLLGGGFALSDACTKTGLT